MGKRGPQKKPTQLAKLQGNPGRRPLNKGEPAPELPDGMPRPPEWLDAVATSCWLRIVPILHPLKLATVADLEAIAKYCDAYSRWRAARDFLNQHGMTYPIKDEKGKLKCLMQFPQVSIYRNMLLVLQRYEAMFGMTPASRTGITVPSQERHDDAMESFLARNN